MGNVPDKMDDNRTGEKPDTIERTKVKNKNWEHPGNHLPDAGNEGIDVQETQDQTMRG